MEMEMDKTIQTAAKPRLAVRAILVPDILMVVQFLLGMYINLYIKFPTSGPADAWSFAWHSLPVAAHIILGTIILLATAITFIQSIRHKDRHMIIAGAIGVTAMLLSVIGGETFITTQNALASYLMSVGFLIGILSLNVGFLTQ
jgi:hypothetical protein